MGEIVFVHTGNLKDGRVQSRELWTKVLEGSRTQVQQVSCAAGRVKRWEKEAGKQCRVAEHKHKRHRHALPGLWSMWSSKQLAADMNFRVCLSAEERLVQAHPLPEQLDWAGRDIKGC